MAAPNPEKSGIPPATEEPFFPPPPPGPPPAAQQHPPTTDTQQPYFPPPPPGPPPAQHANVTNEIHPLKQNPPLHSNEYPIPEYNPAQPYYSPPPDEALKDDPPSDDEARKAHAHKTSRGWGEKLSHLGMKAAAPINSLANKMGSQSFLPTTMDKECEKAGKILKSFVSK
jgi:SH3 domain-containing YSC84-like protein 1